MTGCNHIEIESFLVVHLDAVGTIFIDLSGPGCSLCVVFLSSLFEEVESPVDVFLHTEAKHMVDT